MQPMMKRSTSGGVLKTSRIQLENEKSRTICASFSSEQMITRRRAAAGHRALELPELNPRKVVVSEQQTRADMKNNKTG
ncbi:hypothetical protein T265_12083 [Opisthorchis viverrini]|uniref:Uncharacterized protein n=1 Tax=Opisthorchis viverrini TaxID=6198 RepID=A0A074Z6U0_OPIVI|nr:hypothetical protein T265_12083 [Opisthorchis viverrini]KER18955.1 hypothetical protein T265_12083 [Opisthorchis viverrini]